MAKKKEPEDKGATIAEMLYCSNNCCMTIEVSTKNKKPLSIAQMLSSLCQMQTELIRQQVVGELHGARGFKFKWEIPEDESAKEEKPNPPPGYFGGETQH